MIQWVGPSNNQQSAAGEDEMVLKGGFILFHWNRLTESPFQSLDKLPATLLLEHTVGQDTRWCVLLFDLVNVEN